MADKKTNIASKVRNAVEDVIVNAGYTLWDVAYYKEGPEMILEISIDREDGISINDCAEVTRLVEPIIDELDPIEERYCLQVASAGMVRPLSKEDHLRFARDSRLDVTVGLYVAIDGSKEYNGVIEEFDDDSVTIISDGVSRRFEMKQISKINAEFDAEEPADNNKETDDEQGTV